MDRPTSVLLIAIYCFLFSVFFMFLGFLGIEQNHYTVPLAEFKTWLTIIAPLALMAASLALGIGILRYSNRCWRTLFFLLLFLIGTMTSIIMVIAMLLLLSNALSCSFLEIFNACSTYWFPFIFSFLSQIIVLYYLAREDVRSYFQE